MSYTQDGEWIDAGLTGKNPIITGGPLRLIKSDGVVIAFLPTWSSNKAEKKEAQANARLIAAAPELLNALRELEEAARMVQAGEMDRQSIDVDRRKARAAIAKALGDEE